MNKKIEYKLPDLSVENNKGFYHYSKLLALDMGSIQNPKSKIQN